MAPDCFASEVRPGASMPFDLEGAAVRLSTTGQRVPGWVIEQNSAGSVPSGQDAGPDPESIALVPYGCARLRIAEFPVAERTQAGRQGASHEAAAASGPDQSARHRDPGEPPPALSRGDNLDAGTATPRRRV